MLNLILIGLVLVLLALGFYLGWRLKALKSEVEARGEYIKKQTAMLGALVSAAKRGEDLEKFIEEVDDAITPERLNELYESLLPKRPNT